MRTLCVVFLLVATASALPLERKRDLEDWKKAGLISEDKLKDVGAAEVEKVAKNLREDMDVIGEDLDDLLKEGAKGEAGRRVMKHLDKAVELAKLHEKEGAESIPPADIDIPKGCREEDFGNDCKENFERVVGCLKMAVDHMKETFDSKATVVEKIGEVKGVVGLVAKARDPIKALAKHCEKEMKREFEDWKKAGLISEDELKDEDPAEFEKVAKNLREDMDAFGEDLDELLKEGAKGEAGRRVMGHLDKAVKLAQLHEKEGAESIPPADIDIPKGCREEDFGNDCKENFERVVGCLKMAVDHMKETFDSKATVVEKIGEVKGIVRLVDKATGPIKALAKACEHEVPKKRDFEDWAEAALVSVNKLNTMDTAEVERVGKNLREDMDDIEDDLDDLLDEDADEQTFKKVKEHLDVAVKLAKLHEKEGAGSIPPTEPKIPEGCRKEDLGKDCDENFKRFVGCLKKAVGGMKEIFDDSEATVVEKVSVVKGIVGKVAKSVGEIKELHDKCAQKRSLSRFFN